MAIRFFLKDTGIIDEKFRREIICAIDDEIIVLIANNIPDICGMDHLIICVNRNVRIHLMDSLLSGQNFRFADIFRLMDDLSLQIG